MQEAIAGSGAGLAQVAVGYPFDTIKVHYVKYGKFMFSGAEKHGFGLRDLFRGIGSPLVGSVAINMQQFWVYGEMQKIYPNTLISGAVAGTVLSAVESPVEFIKCQMQTSYCEKTKTMKSESYRQVINRIGPGNIFRGFWLTVARNAPAVGIYFWAYHNIKPKFSNIYAGAFVGGAVAGVACWVPTYPIDNWKTQVQTSDPHKKFSTWKIIKQTGPRNCWRGFWPCIIRAGVVNPFIFMAYEFMKAHS